MVPKLNKFHDEFSPCDCCRRSALPFGKQVSDLVTCDFVASVVEGLTQLRYVYFSAVVSEEKDFYMLVVHDSNLSILINASAAS